jgi:hypothetical protein
MPESIILYFYNKRSIGYEIKEDKLKFSGVFAMCKKFDKRRFLVRINLKYQICGLCYFLVAPKGAPTFLEKSRQKHSFFRGGEQRLRGSAPLRTPEVAQTPQQRSFLTELLHSS